MQKNMESIQFEGAIHKMRRFFQRNFYFQKFYKKSRRYYKKLSGILKKSETFLIEKGGKNMECAISVHKKDFSIACEVCHIPCDEESGIYGGFVLNGMVNVENIITVKKQHRKKHLFLEKKLPFQILVMDLGEACHDKNSMDQIKNI
ncbi:hypothetical protein [Bacillus toyonensis]|uniref:hypothetical protein n=1 Tax=Bacillus toyonensis TaxID=155322 RepID=UPI002E1DDC1F|nr:hypothetical protein [Bacillus toyonensis]